MKYLFYSFLLIVLHSCGPKDNDLAISEDELILFGNKLAEWSGVHCEVIIVNGFPINFEGVNTGGCSVVYFQDEDFREDAPEPYSTYYEKSLKVMDNLREVFRNNDCNISELKNYLESFDPSHEVKADLVTALSCLGTLAFEEVEFGPE